MIDRLLSYAGRPWGLGVGAFGVVWMMMSVTGALVDGRSPAGPGYSGFAPNLASEFRPYGEYPYRGGGQ